MAEQASPQQMNRFVRTVDEFFRNYARLVDPATRSAVYATGDSRLISDYEQSVTQGRILSNTINATVGAWDAAKRAWASVTDATSTWIGDAIDTVRSWFGDDPAPGFDGLVADPSPISGGQLGFLGAIQLPAAAWVAAIIASAVLLNNTMNKIFVSIEASRIQRADPSIPRGEALTIARNTMSSGFFGLGKATVPLLLGAAAVGFLLLRKR